MLLGAQGLLDDPGRPATPARVQKTIEALGFVQVDSICTIARAHELTLAARFFQYRPNTLRTLLEDKRLLFENWTHDASIIPTTWYAHWKHRFAKVGDRIKTSGWWQKRFGDKPEKTLAEVEARIRADGPLFSRDFDGPRPPDSEKGWWGWTTTKAALELLWRSGKLAIARRVNFQKVYDLSERVYPDHHAAEAPEWSEHVDWACRTALDRLGFATPRELAHYWASISLADARAWCTKALAQGELIQIDKTYAFHDWERRANKLGSAPDVLRFLAPFDPVIRDRARAQRLFDFDYTFEAFVPAPKRVYGYYVLPILLGDRFIGRIEPKLHREKDMIEVRGVWWEPKIRETKVLRARLDEALERLAAFTEVKTIWRGRT